jgi:peptide/nickel transport system permease protein
MTTPRRDTRRVWRSLVAAKWPVLALGILAVVAVVAALGPWLAPLDPARQSITSRLAEPLTDVQGVTHWLGSDVLGRDVLSRLLYGASWRACSPATSAAGSTM